VVEATNLNFTRCFAKQTHDAFHGGAFPCSIGTQQAYHFPPIEVKTHLFDGSLLIVYFGELRDR
jgi:hypothetical protein